MAIPQLQNLGLSGVAFCGVDVGGFYGDTNPELLARWTELGIVQPFCRNHSHIESVPQEPWRFGEPWTGLIRKSLELRMRLLPYLYGAFEECSRTGAPILRPLLFDHPGRGDLHHRRRAAARRRAARGADHAPGHRAPPRLPPGGDVGALVERRADRRAGARARPRAARAAGAVRARERGDPAVAGDAEHGLGAAAGAAAADRVRAGRGGVRARALRGRRRGLRRSARRSVRCDGTRIELGERRGDYVPPGREAIELELRGVEPGTSVRVDGEQAEAREEDGALVVALEESAAARADRTLRAGPLIGAGGPHRPRPCRSRPARTASSCGWCRSRRKRRRCRRSPPSAPRRAAAAPRGR